MVIVMRRLEVSNHQVDADHQSGELAHLSKTWKDVGNEIDPHHELPVPDLDSGIPKPRRFTDADLRRLARELQAAEEAGYVMRKRWHCSDYRHNHGRKIAAWLCERLWLK